MSITLPRCMLTRELPIRTTRIFGRGGGGDYRLGAGGRPTIRVVETSVHV